MVAPLNCLVGLVVSNEQLYCWSLCRYVHILYNLWQSFLCMVESMNLHRQRGRFVFLIEGHLSSFIKFFVTPMVSAPNLCWLYGTLASFVNSPSCAMRSSLLPTLLEADRSGGSEPCQANIFTCWSNHAFQGLICPRCGGAYNPCAVCRMSWRVWVCRSIVVPRPTVVLISNNILFQI